MCWFKWYGEDPPKSAAPWNEHRLTCAQGVFHDAPEGQAYWFPDKGFPEVQLTWEFSEPVLKAVEPPSLSELASCFPSSQCACIVHFDKLFQVSTAKSVGSGYVGFRFCPDILRSLVSVCGGAQVALSRHTKKVHPMAACSTVLAAQLWCTNPVGDII